MAIALEILNGTIRSMEKARNDMSNEDRTKVASCLRDISEALNQCIAGVQQTKEVPSKALAHFLSHCKTLKQLTGDRLDKEATDQLRNALLHAQMFDKDLVVSLEQFKPKLLKTFLLGAPINWLFGANKAIGKLELANQALKALGEKLEA